MACRDITYHRPQSIAEACQIAGEYGIQSRFLAGGTELLNDLESGRDRADHLISLRGITDQSEIGTANGELRIGAFATLSAVAAAPDVARTLPALREAILTMGGQQIRNRATIGGNFCRAVPCADTPPVCIAAGARLEIVGATGARTLPAAGFFVGPRQTVLDATEILTEIRIPVPPAGLGASYQRFSLRRGMAVAVAAVAALLRLDGDEITSARVVLSAVAPVPLLVAECSELLVGRKPAPDLFAQAGVVAAAAAQPVTDLRGSAEFRRDLVAVLTPRALREATRRAQGEAV
jgi:CO/xanthine dehydrogenase FAD-binding subunit